MAGTMGRACAAEVWQPLIITIQALGLRGFLCRVIETGDKALQRWVPGKGILRNLGTSYKTVTSWSLNAPESGQWGLDQWLWLWQTQHLLFKKMQIYWDIIHKPLPFTILRYKIQWFSPLPITILEYFYHPQNESVCPLALTRPLLYPFQPMAIINRLPVSVFVYSRHFIKMEIQYAVFCVGSFCLA